MQRLRDFWIISLTLVRETQERNCDYVRFVTIFREHPDDSTSKVARFHGLSMGHVQLWVYTSFQVAVANSWLWFRSGLHTVGSHPQQIAVNVTPQKTSTHTYSTVISTLPE